MNDFQDSRPLWKRLKKMLDEQLRKVNLWENARFIIAEVPLNAELTKRILPFGLWNARPARGTLFIVNYTKTSFTEPYKEAALLIHVRTPLGQGVHCPWMVVDDDTALIYGRELLGYPKKMAEIEFLEDESRISASVVRRGVKVLAMEGAKGERQENPEPVFARKTINAGGLGQFFLLNPLWLFRPEEVIHESREMEVKVEINESEFDPISPLVSGPPLSGRMVVMDIPGSRYNLPVGIAGPRFFANTFKMRFR